MNQIVEEQICQLIEKTLNDLGFALCQVKLKNNTPKTLEILLDKLDNTSLTISDCKVANFHISTILDVEDPIIGKYYLEVSSSGPDRPIIKFEDYNRFVGREVNIKLKELFNEKTRYIGTIIKAEDANIYLNILGDIIILPFNLIKKASLIFTDDMFRKLLKK
jgi:ribosome maturation factor RimP